MFTGIIEELGTVVGLDGNDKGVDIKIQSNIVLQDTILGDSISVNGICLTVTKMGSDYFTAQMMTETLQKTAMKNLKTGSIVNLERALTLNKRLGGHIVSGHVDETGSVFSIRKDGIANIISIKISSENKKYLIHKGSITVNGTSLTISKVQDDYFEVSIIPHTKDKTNISLLKSGDLVNLEFDIIGKYVERLLGLDTKKQNDRNIDLDFLKTNGFL